MAGSWTPVPQGVAPSYPFGAILAQSGIPFMLPPTGTMGNNGAFTLGTAANQTVPRGYVWMATGQIFTSSVAGWYYFTMSSATAMTVFNNTYSSGQVFIPSPTSFVSTGAGALTGVTNTAIQGPTIAIPANTLGPNGELQADCLWSSDNSAGTKTLGFSWGGNANGMGFFGGSGSSLSGIQARVRNCGVTNQQEYGNGGTGDFTSGNANAFYTTADTTKSVTTYFYLQMNTATDWVMVEGHSFKVFPN